MDLALEYLWAAGYLLPPTPPPEPPKPPVIPRKRKVKK